MYQPDVVIVGAGMGGLITGALLAKFDRRRVLVLEKEAEIGGRVMSYGGPHGSYSEKDFRKLLQVVERRGPTRDTVLATPLRRVRGST